MAWCLLAVCSPAMASVLRRLFYFIIRSPWCYHLSAMVLFRAYKKSVAMLWPRPCEWNDAFGVCCMAVSTREMRTLKNCPLPYFHFWFSSRGGFKMTKFILCRLSTRAIDRASWQFIIFSLSISRPLSLFFAMRSAQHAMNLICTRSYWIAAHCAASGILNVYVHSAHCAHFISVDSFLPTFCDWIMHSVERRYRSHMVLDFSHNFKLIECALKSPDREIKCIFTDGPWARLKMHIHRKKSTTTI